MAKSNELNAGAWTPFVFPFSSPSLYNTLLSAPDGIPLFVIRTSGAESSSATIVVHTKNPHVGEDVNACSVVAALRWDKWEESVMWIGRKSIKIDRVVGALVEEECEKLRTFILPTPVGEWRWSHPSQLEFFDTSNRLLVKYIPQTSSTFPYLEAHPHGTQYLDLIMCSLIVAIHEIECGYRGRSTAKRLLSDRDSRESSSSTARQVTDLNHAQYWPTKQVEE